jgi:RNA polymerase sigma-70 factor, ECF subfamily
MADETTPSAGLKPDVSRFNFKREMLAALPRLRAFAVSLCGNAAQADDLVQDTVLKAWSHQDQFEPGSNMIAWLITILRNQFYSAMRKSGREIQDSDGLFTDALASHPAQYGSMDMLDFRKALEKLPADQREAIILIGASGVSYEEAAAICGCAVGTIKSRVNRARIRLQDLLGITDSNDYGPDAVSSPLVKRAFVT